LDTQKNLHIALLVPTYNEAKNIPALLDEIRLQMQLASQIKLCLFIIDDNSPDKTAQIVLELAHDLQSDNFQIKTICRKEKEGLGSAYIHGFKDVMARGNYDYIIQMDADLSHNPVYLSTFFDAALRGLDLVVASRYQKGGGIPDWSWYRRVLSKFGNLYARLLLGSQISDYTGGFNMFSIDLLHKMPLNALQHSGYGFLIGLKFQAVRHAKKIESFPIVFIDRVAGQSKMPINTVFKSFFLVFNLWRTK
jgi:dolichol-phosphate mannosyltransferase